MEVCPGSAKDVGKKLEPDEAAPGEAPSKVAGCSDAFEFANAAPVEASFTEAALNDMLEFTNLFSIKTLPGESGFDDTES